MAETCADKPAPLKVLFLAPLTGTGGITTWTRTWRKFSDPSFARYTILDTSRQYRVMGAERLGLRGVVMGLGDAAIRMVHMLLAIRQLRPGLVYINCAPSIGLWVRDTAYMFLLRALRIPVVIHLHGGNVDGFFGGNMLRRAWVRAAMRTCRVIFVITREMEKAGRRIFDPDMIVYVPVWLNDDVVNRGKDAPRRAARNREPFHLLHVGWQARAKGSFELVEAMRYVKHVVQCNLVGEVAPENRCMLEAMIRDHDVGDRVRLVGRADEPHLWQLYRDADLFVFPTHKSGPEGFPSAILEAMAYGLPILVNEVGAIREMIGYDTDRPAGILLEQVDPIEPKELAEKIDRLLDDAVLRARLSENARRRVGACYRASIIVPELEELLGVLVRGHPTGRDRHRWGRCEEGTA
jgi:glycosyltransferase involved in cell wall biosynthesis